LNVLSIGNNKIPSFEIVTQYFSKGKGMKFKNLQVLNVAGNPFTKEPDYKNHIINSLPNLRYLDYSFIDEAQRNQIRESDEKFRTDAIT
jgi:Leucine-rich repeat (LRR) protein